MIRKFDLRTESTTRYEYWKKILVEKGIRYEKSTIQYSTSIAYILTIEAEDDLKYDKESDVDDWELCSDGIVNLKYICTLLCIPYDSIKFVYRE